MIEVPLRLKMRESPAKADALLILTTDAARLAAACGWFKSLPRIHRVHDGFLVIPSEPLAHEPVAAVRLRRLGGELFLPANADLLPALLPDEIRGLTNREGLVLLPGGEALAFDPKKPLNPNEWLTAPRVGRNAWRPFPPRANRPESLTRIERPSDTPAAVIETLQAGRPDDAEPLPGTGEAARPVPEDARPPSSSFGKRLAAEATLAAGQLLAFAGRIFRSPNLAKLGGRLARKAIESVPRLTEKVLGAQEAALRNILRQLQSGDVEKALRRAPIAVPDPESPGRVDTGSRLSKVDPRYLLSNLLGGGGGTASIWLGGGDVWGQLAAEYRRLAQEALARGDFRRAAYLYGILLRDLRSAANALASGGLHRDAAVLYRDKLNDLLAAAQQFERACAIDEAVRLYERLDRFEEAADLLRRAGDEDRATDYYLRAANRHAADGQWRAAGDLVRNRLGDLPKAREFYRQGWNGWTTDTVPCGERLLDEFALAADWKQWQSLLAEARTSLAPPRATDAGRFFNYALKLGDLVPNPHRADLADAARTIFAEHLRESSRPVHLAGQLFSGGAPWPPEVTRDALFAASKSANSDSESGVTHEPPLKSVDGTVVACVTARTSRDLIIATTTRVICWRAADGTVEPVFNVGRHRRILGLATDDFAHRAYVLYGEGVDLYLRCISLGVRGHFEPDGQVRFLNVPGSGTDWRLNPIAEPLQPNDPECVVILLHPKGNVAYKGPLLKGFTLNYGLLYEGTNLVIHKDQWIWSWDRAAVQLIRPEDSRFDEVPTRWQPAIPPQSTLTVPTVDWMFDGSYLELSGLDQDGKLHWMELRPSDNPVQVKMHAHAVAAHATGFSVACCTSLHSVAAITADHRICRYVFYDGKLTLRQPPRPLLLSHPAVYLTAIRPNELVAVLSDGSVVRLPQS